MLTLPETYYGMILDCDLPSLPCLPKFQKNNILPYNEPYLPSSGHDEQEDDGDDVHVFFMERALNQQEE